MACFLVSAAEAVAATAAEKAAHSAENKGASKQKKAVIPFSRKLKWLTWLLWGGAFLLAFEHVWHGEVTPWFPFLTAMNSAEDTSEMLHEMATTGVGMAALITLVWAGICVAAERIVRRPEPKASVEA